MTVARGGLPSRIAERLLARNEVADGFFCAYAEPLARVCDRMAERFLRGGRLIAFGRGAWATDAQHVAVEFVHPVIVGKRALPAVDLSADFPHWVRAIVRDVDIVMGFSPPVGDPLVARALRDARRRGALTFALPGRDGEFTVEPPAADPFVVQELIEVLYHTLWETVHVFYDHRAGSGSKAEAGEASFLYPFLGRAQEAPGAVPDARDGAHDDDANANPALVSEVAQSIRAKAAEDARLRE